MFSRIEKICVFRILEIGFDFCICLSIFVYAVPTGMLPIWHSSLRSLIFLDEELFSKNKTMLLFKISALRFCHFKNVSEYLSLWSCANFLAKIGFHRAIFQNRKRNWKRCSEEAFRNLFFEYYIVTFAISLPAFANWGQCNVSAFASNSLVPVTIIVMKFQFIFLLRKKLCFQLSTTV